MMSSMVIYTGYVLNYAHSNFYIRLYLLDVRTLVNNDEGLQDGILQALEQYNTEQHITVTLPGSEHEVNN
jgi:hypothetical protein